MENVNTYTHVPPGFRFHPTDEELVDYYLRRKINSRRIDLNVIKDVDLYKIEPWDLQEICRMGNEEQSEWFFFSHKDRKYPTGSRTNRATTAGFWKATGRDKAVYSKHNLIGMRKTLVFYKGRAPNGQKSDWIMHEYRLENLANGAPQEEGWVVCKVTKKKSSTTMRNTQDSPSCWYDHNYQVSSMFDLDSFPKELDHHHRRHHHLHHQHRRLVLPDSQIPQDHLIHLPLLDNSKVVIQPSSSNNAIASYINIGVNQEGNYSMQQVHDNGPTIFGGECDQGALEDHATDWRVLDKFVASQFSQEDINAPKGNNNNTNMNYSSTSSIVSELLINAPLSHDYSNKEESMLDNASTSTSSSQIDRSMEMNVRTE